MFALHRFAPRRGLVAAAAALLLSGVLSSGALAWQGPVEGRPRGFHPGRTPGYFLWHNGGTTRHWHLQATAPRGTSHVFSGTLLTDGRFTDLAAVHTEADDVEWVGPDRIDFRLLTGADVDGLSWSIDGGSQLTVLLLVDGEPAPPALIHLGRASATPPTNPMTFWR